MSREFPSVPLRTVGCKAITRNRAVGRPDDCSGASAAKSLQAESPPIPDAVRMSSKIVRFRVHMPELQSNRDTNARPLFSQRFRTHDIFRKPYVLYQSYYEWSDDRKSHDILVDPAT